MSSKTLFQISRAAYVALLLLMTAWFGNQGLTGQYSLVFSLLWILPLLAPLKGILTGKPYTYAWASFIICLYMLHGLTLLYVTETDRLFAVVEVMLLSLLTWQLPAAATSVLPISLQRMTAAADLIFHGKVVASEVRHDPASGRVVTLTTFAVIEIIKGETGETHTIKQIGGHLPGSNVRQVIQGVPGFSTGREYVVFLPRASSLGFSSPIGLSQGKFDVQRVAGQALIRSRHAAAADSAPSSSWSAGA